MNVVFLSPHFPLNFHHFCSRLHKAGVNVLGIDQVAYEVLPEGLQASLHDYYRVRDLHNYTELANGCRYFIDQYGPIDRIESHNEYWLPTQARLASEFHIPGLNLDTVADVTRKSKMKSIFQNAGMNPARGELVTTLERALQFAQEVGYPLMLKPDIGVGACGCHKINSSVDLHHFFNSKPAQEYLMEEFIEGTICTFDGLVDRSGELVFHTSHVYGSGIAEVVRHKLDQVYYSLRTIPDDVEAIGRKTLEAFHVKERFFHFEYFRAHTDSRLIPIEVNMRPPGSPGLDMCNFACDIDLYQKWAELIAGKVSASFYDRKYHCMSVSRRFQNRYLYSHEEVLERGGDHIVHHNAPLPLHKDTMGDYYYVVRHPDLQKLLELQHFMHQLR